MYFTFINGSSEQKIEFNANESLLCALRRAGVSFYAPCSGRGSCGKCKVKLNCFTPPSKAEEELLSEKEIQSGIRLACRTKAQEGTVVQAAKQFDKIAAVEHSNASQTPCLRAVADIGTTTVTVGFIDKSGNIVSTKSENNAQSVFGADVIARIEGDTRAQQKLIIEQLKKLTDCKVNSLVVCGNTAMLHILFGADCSGLKVFPFAPVFLDTQIKKIDTLTLTSLPCIDTFIGSDIYAGILAAKPEQQYKLLVDLGTNAEIVLFNNENIFAVSAAAGPAFEGAGIRCGMAASSGAVCAFSIDNNTKNITTINSEPPQGICGSGLLDIVAALIKKGIIDEGGAMLEDCFKIFGDVALYPEDVRKLQLAKAAVRAGIDCLMKKSGISYDEIGEVLLSGGLGNYLNTESAISVGLLPALFRDKARAAGNTALEGTALWAKNEVILSQKTTVFPLAGDRDFEELFIQNMVFEI